MRPLTCRLGFSLVASILVPAVARAQSEAALRDAFEGTSVTVTLDMPGTSDGVNLYPSASAPIDMAAYRAQLDECGTAIAAGARATVTKIRVKKDLIEFQLDGGGYGTFGDVLDNLSAEPQQSATLVPESPDEHERKLRAKAGSRFNLRFRQRVTPEQLTPTMVRAALARYVRFDVGAESMPVAQAPSAPPNSTTAPPPPPVPAAPSAIAWQPRVGWDNQLFPSYVIATASVRPEVMRPDDPSTLGDRNGQIGVAITAPAAGTKVVVTVASAGLMEPSSTEVLLPVGGQTYVVRPTLGWNYDALAKVRQTRPATVTVRVTVNGVELPAKVVTATLRAVNDCPFYALETDAAGRQRPAPLWWMFAAYVNENHPLNDQLRREALDAGIVTNFKGYQGTTQQVVQEVYALWNALQRRGVTYSNVTTTAAESRVVFSQQVRFIEQSVGNAQANCVDGSVLFASLLRQIGIDPILVHVPGHMYVGFFLDEAHGQRMFLETTEMGQASLRGGDVLGLGEAYRNQTSWNSFAAAVTDANNAYNQHLADFQRDPAAYQLIDVKQARVIGIGSIPYAQ